MNPLLLNSCKVDTVIKLKGKSDYWIFVDTIDVAVGDWREPRYVLFNLTNMQTEIFDPEKTEVEPQISSNETIPWLPLLLHLLQRVNEQAIQLNRLTEKLSYSEEG